MMQDERVVIAYHEAGHAVAGYLYGLAFDEMKIVYDPEHPEESDRMPGVQFVERAEHEVGLTQLRGAAKQDSMGA